MEKLIFLVVLFFSLTANAQNHLISFAGTGESTTVSTVKVENLTAGTSLTLGGSDKLSLTITTGVHSIDNDRSSLLKIYPNPMTDNSTLEIFPPVSGDAVITILDITGRQVAQVQSFLENSRQDYRLSGLKNGFYLIDVKGNGYHFSGKLLCKAESNGTISIIKQNNNVQYADKTGDGKASKGSKGTEATVDMEYSTGDRLKFTGISGNYSTVMTDTPSSDITITFNFIACTDGDNNNYPVVQIGTQVWMAENLKTTKYRNGDLIGTTTPSTLNITGEPTAKYQWSYDANENNVSTYGRLYTWYVINESRHLCPTGWHISSDAEWMTLTTFLGGEGVAGGKLKETGITHWQIPNSGATNENGFTALPGGKRSANGVFINMRFLGYWYCSDVTFFTYWRSINNNVQRMSVPTNDGFSVRCLKGEVLPALTTTSASSIGRATATSGGKITSYGGATITARGVCWSSSHDPTIANSKTVDPTGPGLGTFSSSITGLTPLTTYYVRAYATNSIGTAYGNEISFITTESGLGPGDSYQGGIIAYILQPGDPGYIAGETHGLIAAPTDQSSGIRWQNSSNTFLGVTATAIGMGNANTNAIVASQGAGGYAAKLCYDLELGGYSDWYLPSVDELNLLRLNKNAIGGFADLVYWSSTEGDKDVALGRNFNNYWDNSFIYYKGNTELVRAVRAF